MELRSGKIVDEMDSERSEASHQETSSDEGQQVAAPGLADILQQIKEMMLRNTQEIKQDVERNAEKMQQNVQKKIEETARITSEEIKKTTEKVEKMYEEIRKVESDVKKQMEEQKKEWTSDIQRTRLQVEEVKADVEPIKDRLRKLEERRPEKVQVNLHPSMLRGVDSDLKFYGDRRIHPVVYLKALGERLEEMGDRTEFKKIIRPTMKGSAELWYDMVEEKLDTVDDFTNAFLDYFWGEQAQSKVRENLYTGKYDETYGSSREEYAMRKMAVARYLEPQLSEGDIVKYIARHFADEIRDVVAIQGIDEVGKLLQYLRRVDDIKPVRRNRYVRMNPGEENGNKTRSGEKWNWETRKQEQRPQGINQKNRRESNQIGTGRLERERGEATDMRPRYGQQYQTNQCETRPRYNQMHQEMTRGHSNEARSRYPPYQERRSGERPRYQREQYREQRDNTSEHYACNMIQKEGKLEGKNMETIQPVNGHGRQETVIAQIEPPPRRQDF